MDERFLECELVIESRTYTLTEVCAICGVHATGLRELVAFGIIAPAAEHPDGGLFSEAALHRAKRAIRLQRDLELAGQGLALALDLLDEVERLRRLVRQQGRE